MKYIIFLFILTQFLYAGDFDIEKFSNPHKYGWEIREQQLESRENLFNRQKLLQIYQLNKQNPSSNLLKTIILPGWGHFSAKRYTKGQILLGAEIILLGSSLYYYDQAREYYNKYKKATYIVDIDNYYESTKLPLRLSQGFLTLGIVFWLYSIYDSTIVTEEYNKDLWENLILEYHDKKLQITPTGISLRF